MDKKELFNTLINAKQRFSTMYKTHPYTNRDRVYIVLNQVYADICANHNLNHDDYNDNVAELFYKNLGIIGINFVDLYLV